MPPITALLHTENDALRLGRCLETLYPCDGIFIVDHGSRDHTVRIAREYGALIVTAEPGVSLAAYLRSVSPGWLLLLDPCESLSESLAASLYEWRWLHAGLPPAPAFSVFLREETPEGWVENPLLQTRLVPLAWDRWDGRMPKSEPSAIALQGNLLRFWFP